MLPILILLFAGLLLILSILIPVVVSRAARFRSLSIFLGILTAGVMLASISFYTVPSGQVGHLSRIYFGQPLPEGQLIALPGQNGPQADTLGPGIHFKPLLKVIYQVETFPVISIPNDQYGIITAKAGVPLSQGSYLAEAWPEEETAEMLQAAYFIQNGGVKGTQLTILQPGQYRLNRYLFDVSLQPALDVEAGSVAVIKSNVQESADCPDPISSSNPAFTDSQALAVNLVPQGCSGIWEQPLLPGRYYLNRLAYQATIIPTQAQSLLYRGGHERYAVDLTVDQQGKISEQVSSQTVEVPDEAAGSAIVVNIEGWPVPLEIQAVIQVDALQAPILLASVGDLNTLEKTLITPTLRNAVRDVLETDERRVLDLIEDRAALEAAVEEAMQSYGQTIGVTVHAVNFGDVALPAELQAVQQRQLLAAQLQTTYEQEERTQQTRIEAENTAALADQQANLVAAELAVEIAALEAQAAQKLGEGERLRYLEIVEVLSEDGVLQLVLLEELLAAAQVNPDLIKVPMVYVTGDAEGLAGQAAVLSAGNLLEFMNIQAEAQDESSATE